MPASLELKLRWFVTRFGVLSADEAKAKAMDSERLAYEHKSGTPQYRDFMQASNEYWAYCQLLTEKSQQETQT